ncbi:MAG: MerR family transcriptional regulator [Thermoanaerobacteraceae bacterium]|nr:MerR family transcriptional regulator [Thermoanaerobacteraceae bacterium]
MLKIGDFSKLSRISIRMLRYYDEIGLLVPENIDEFTGYRYYSEAQLPLANRINSLKDMGFSLSVISEILKAYIDPQALKEYLLLKHAELKELAEKTSRQLRILEATINRIGKEDNVMEYSVVLKEIPQRYVASLRKTIPSYDKEGILWEQMMKEIASQNVQYANPCNCTAVFHDKEHKEHDPDVEIQISVQGRYQNTENVVFKTVPFVLVASATFKGSYDQLTAVNQAVANWIRDNGYDFDGAMFTVYHVSPAQTQNPDEFVTEVCFPVKKK